MMTGMIGFGGALPGAWRIAFFGFLLGLLCEGQTIPTREELTYEPLGPSSRRTGVTISEILYHPAQRSDGREIEFLELYNSQPWAEDLSGWRLSGEIDFTFPEGSLIPGEGFLVVARAPGDVEAEYGLDGVLGPWEGALANEGGRIRLRKPSDAIVLEINYDDRGPWPLAADGAGHSLILARPSYSERDERAWEASAALGGSPGQADPVPAGELDHVFVAAILSNSPEPLVDFIELRNAAPFPVDLSGCFLSDQRDLRQRFTIPAGTVIEAGAVLRFDEAELGFALGSEGDAVYLTKRDGTQVLDAVIVPPTRPGVVLSRRRSDVPLRPEQAPTIVINELMFHPPTRDERDEWIEIYNRSEESEDLSGWAFTDGIGFTFPVGTVLSAGGFLIVAKDRSRVLALYPELDPTLVLGGFDGRLSDGGERIALARLSDGLLVVEDELSYRDQSWWHRFSDGRGATLERRDPHAETFFAANWADSDDSHKSEWTTIEFTGTLAHGNPSASPGQVQMFLLGPGEALVDQVEVVREDGANLLANGDFDDGDAGWSFQGNHRRSFVAGDQGLEGSAALQLVATRRGDPGPNRARANLTQTPSPGSRATLRARVRWLAGHPEFLMRLRGNWLEAPGPLPLPTNLGTPGERNSQFLENRGPRIEEVVHHPLLPEAGEPIRVTAAVSDPDGVQTVVVRYRLDPSPILSAIIMNDDGEGADLTADDGIFSAEIPAQEAGTLIAFEVGAMDGKNTVRYFLEGREGLIRVADPGGEPTFATYRLWITEDSLREWNRQPFRSNDPFPLTFVYNGARAIYGAGGYYGGNKDSNSYPTTGTVSYDVVLPPGDEFLGADKLTLDHPVRDPTNQREQLQHWFADQLGLPTLHRRDIHLYMNGIRRRTIYHDAEQPDGVVVESHFPGDEGELFKTSNDNETTNGGSRIRPFVRNIIDVFEADGEIRPNRYRWTTAKRARGSRTRLDEASILELMRRADATGPGYEEGLLEIIDMENWMRTWAMIDLGSFWDAFGNTNYKNSYLYKPENAGWVQMVWDMDVGLGVDSRDPPNQPLFPSNVDRNLKRMYETPTFIRAYWRAMEEALTTFYSTEGVTPLLERKRAAYDRAGLGFTSPFVPSGAGRSIPQFIETRAAFIRPQLEALDQAFAVTGPADQSSTDEPSVVISGTAPVAATTIEANGIPLDLNWATVTSWSAPFALLSGRNDLLIRAFDDQGNEVGSEVRSIIYEGPSAIPEVIINEWMASNETTLPDPTDGNFDDWFELFNPGPSPLDLSGWFLSDDPGEPFRFRIPDGFVIPAGGFFLVWADGEVSQNETGAGSGLHVNFRLAAAGESLVLTSPTGARVDQVDFGPQSPDKTMGRVGEEVTALAVPSPGSPNGVAARSPKLMVTPDGKALTFTITTEPGFRYQMETSPDLATWQPLGSIMRAEGVVLTLTESWSDSRSFYRVRRIP